MTVRILILEEYQLFDAYCILKLRQVFGLISDFPMPSHFSCPEPVAYLSESSDKTISGYIHENYRSGTVRDSHPCSLLIAFREP